MRSFWLTVTFIITTLPSLLCAKGQVTPIAVAVSNPSGWERTDSVDVDSPFDVEKTHAVVITNGKVSFAGQVVGDRITFVAKDIPGKSCRLFWIKPVASRASSRLSARSLTLENEHARVSIDPKTGAVSDLFSKLAGKQLVPKGAQACTIEFAQAGKPSTVKLEQVDLIENGPARATIRSEYKCGGSSLVQDVVMHEGLPRVDVKVTVDWQGTPDAELIIAIPIALKDAKASFGPRIGTVGYDWSDLSNRKEGVTVIGDGNFPITADGSAIRLIVAGPGTPRTGMIELSYSIFPHPGGFNPSLTDQVIDMLANPLRGAVASNCPAE